MEFPLGDPADTYVSSILPSASFSTKKQYSVAGRLAVFGPRNQWAVIGDNHVRETGQEMYGGSGDAATTGLDVTFTSFRVMDSYLRRMPRGLFAGVGFLYQRQRDVAPLDSTADWAQSPYVEYSEQFGFELSGQTSAGLAWVLRRDGRDNISDPSRGWYLESAFRTYFEGFLGGASTWQSVALDARGYIRPIAGRRHTLATWTYVDVITGGRAPYFALPATGADPMGRSGRGYAEGRFRGDRLIYSELEYRLPLRVDGLVGMVGFLNATAVGSTFDDEPLFDRAAIGGGFGFRLRLDKRSRTNLCLDFGFGQNGSRGVYLALAEAF
jgi:outer membrane protein assembly factor BamA